MNRVIFFGTCVASVVASGFLAAQDGTTGERTAKVVAERPARLYIMAGFDTECRSLQPVEVTVDRPPMKGSISLREGQQTTVANSASGRCIGAKVVGTGIYYTARAGQSGTDSFSVTAKVGTDALSRTFSVTIAED